jgi:hypothetical protein
LEGRNVVEVIIRSFGIPSSPTGLKAFPGAEEAIFARDSSVSVSREQNSNSSRDVLAEKLAKPLAGCLNPVFSLLFVFLEELAPAGIGAALNFSFKSTNVLTLAIN